MKKILLSACAAIVLAVSGCKTIPTPAELKTVSYAIGTSAALVSNMTKISDSERQIVIDIINEVSFCIPLEGQTIVQAWSSVAKTHIDILIRDGKITELEGQLILKVFDTVANAADYMFRIRWPKIGEYSDLVTAATHGFCDGFLTFFKPANTVSVGSDVNYDKDAFVYLMSCK